MLDLVQSNLPAVRELCSRYRVRRLHLFGSAARGGFQAGSDVDLLVEFEPMSYAEHAACYLDLVQALEELFARPVDLLEPGPIRNPYLQKTIEQTKLLLYEAA
jgi:predicted nucleotidyltransferase